jgi:hypothetical protein
MKTILTILILLIFNCLNAQPCRVEIKNYHSKLNTTSRNIYMIVDDMPDFLNCSQVILMKFSNIDFSSLKCCPIYVWFAFVIENDSRITNILICPEFMFCENEIDLANDTKSVVLQFTKIISEIKTSPGKLNKQPVAFAYISKVYYECR